MDPTTDPTTDATTDPPSSRGARTALAPIPVPEVLDCERPHLADLAQDDEAVAAKDVRALQRAFGDACHYAQRLWQELDALRPLLAERAARGDTATAEQFAQVSSLLTGPRGDNGWAATEARLLARPD